MSQLSDTQRVILSNAAQHEMGMARAPKTLPAAARNAVSRSLIKNNLLTEINAPREHAYDIGLMLRSESKPKRTMAFLCSDAEEVGKVLDAGWEALAGWPSGFNRALDALRERAGERGRRHGLHHKFGHLRVWFDRAGSADWAQPLRFAFANYVNRIGTVSLKASSRAKLGIEGHSLGIPVAVAARKLGMAVSTVRRMADCAGGAFLSKSFGSGAPVMLDAKFVEDIRIRQASTITKELAAQALGISRPALLELLDLHVLGEVPEQERVSLKLCLRRSDIEATVTRMHGAV